MSPTVRTATAADADTIAAIHVRTWRAAYRGLVPDGVLRGLSVEQRERKWRELLSAGDSLTFVGEVDGRIGGFCSAQLPSRDSDATADTAEVTAIYVAPELWRRGLGTALLRATIERLRLAGFRQATLWVFAENASGRGFYARMGWRPDGAEGVHQASGLRTVRLRTELTP